MPQAKVEQRIHTTEEKKTNRVPWFIILNMAMVLMMSPVANSPVTFNQAIILVHII